MVGGPTADRRQVYVALGRAGGRGIDGDTVYVVDADLTAVLKKGPFFFRDKSVAQFDPAKVIKVAIDRRDQSIEMVRGKKGVWTFAKQADAGPVDAELVGALIRAVHLAQAKAFLKNLGDKAAGLVSSKVKIRLTMGGKRGPRLIALSVGGRDDKRRGYYVRVQGRREVMVVGDGFLAKVDKGRADLEDRRVLTLNTAKVVAVEIERPGGRPVKFVKTGAGWRVASGADHCGWQAAWLLARLSRLRYERRMPVKGGKKYWGFNKPLAAVTFRLAGDPKSAVRYVFGMPFAPKPATGEYKGPKPRLWVRRGGSKWQFYVSAAVVKNALPKKGCGRSKEKR